MRAASCRPTKTLQGYGQLATAIHTDMLLQGDVENVERQLIALHDPEVGCWTKAQLDAVVCFALNVGMQRWRTSTLRKCIMQDKPAWLIAKEWKRWVYAGGKQLPGLVKRRDWEAERFFDVSCEWNKNHE